MASAFDSAFETVKQLVATFRANESRYLSSDYLEAEVRKDFIDKFWIALGWDVNHDEQTNPYEQEVKVERGVHAGAARRHADYAFYCSPTFHNPKFYVEAKKPFGDTANAADYVQTIGYAWNAKIPFGVLMDFKEFHILDARNGPSVETALGRRIARYQYSEYSNRETFAEIYWLFSREAVANRSIEKRAAELPKSKGKAVQRGFFPTAYKPVDEAFLEELDELRSDLAHTFKNKNPELDGPDLTELAQRTLDRLVFIRFLEDRGIEPGRKVDDLGSADTPWEKFVAVSRQLNAVYNGVVFRHHRLLDSPTFTIDEDIFADVCNRLATDKTPYDFNVIPIHILGSIYERFLGKVIRTTDKRVFVEEKEEVRKAGGVYYTPEYIVRYIVQQTVGRLIAKKTPAEIAKMRFVDIACGSGSFLLSILDLLLQYHGTYYNANPTRAKKDGCVQREGKQYLTLHQKQEILVNNVFGVDIDSQAVEVAQLSLYLRLLTDETPNTAEQYRLQFGHTAQLLPDLTKNIVCGNSLIGRDVLDGRLFGDDEERRLNPMDFEQRFPTILKAGGFDAVVGNPPYVRIQGFPRDQVEYLTSHFKTVTGNADLYVSFVERAFGLLRREGRFGYILPNKFLRTDYGVGLRRLISSNRALAALVDFGASQVFGATTYTCLLFLTKQPNTTFKYAKAEASSESLATIAPVTMKADSLNEQAWSFADRASADLLKRLSHNRPRLLDIPAMMSRGSSTGDDDVFLVDKTSDIEGRALRVPVFASDFGRYNFSPEDKWRVIFPYEVKNGDSRLLAETELKKNFPRAYAHLKSFQVKLKRRKQYQAWYGFSAPRSLPIHEEAQIVVPLLANRGLFAIVPPEARRRLCMMASGGFTIYVPEGAPLSATYLLGLLNSRLLFWALQQASNVFRGGWVTCTKQYFGELPIAIGDSSARVRLTHLVEERSNATLHLADAKTDGDRTFYEGKCRALDRQIDTYVYELYCLTEADISLVEEEL